MTDPLDTTAPMEPPTPHRLDQEPCWTIGCGRPAVYRVTEVHAARSHGLRAWSQVVCPGHLEPTTEALLADQTGWAPRTVSVELSG